MGFDHKEPVPICRCCGAWRTLCMDLGEAEQKGRAARNGANWPWKKKEEFPRFMETCCLGTPFPRSALFLETSCGYLRTFTRVLKGLCSKVPNSDDYSVNSLFGQVVRRRTLVAGFRQE